MPDFDTLGPSDFGSACAKAIEKQCRKTLLDLCDELEKRVHVESSLKIRSFFYYLLGNLFSSRSYMEKETAAGWQTQDFPVYRAKSIDCFRECLRLTSDHTVDWHSEAKTNLGNELSQQCRGIEALFYWNPDFSTHGDTPFVSALSRSQFLAWVGQWLNDPNHRTLFIYEAYSQLKLLEEHISSTDHAFVRSSFEEDTNIHELLALGDAQFQSLHNWQHSSEESKASDAELSYRKWCSSHRLFANPINLLTTNQIANQDVLQFPNYVVAAGDGPFLPAAFSSAKREFCFARFLAYEGLNGFHPEYENDLLFLTDTLDYVHLDGATEKVKTSLRVCFGVLDSIAFILNHYFKCESNHCAFSSNWIRNNLSGFKNPFLNALFWLACDLTDTDSIPPDRWKAPQAELSEIRKLRNSIEHGWLRIANGKHHIWDDDSDFARTITPKDLRRVTLLTLRVTNCALLYLTLAIKYNEEENSKDSGLVLPMHTPLIDDPEEISRAFGFDDNEI